MKKFNKLVELEPGAILNRGDIVKIRPSSEIDRKLGVKFPSFMDIYCGLYFKVMGLAGIDYDDEGGDVCDDPLGPIYYLEVIEEGPYKTADFIDDASRPLNTLSFQNHMLYLVKEASYQESVCEILKQLEEL